jgi:ribose transport system permease protein
MNHAALRRILRHALDHSALAVFALVLGVFGAISPQFRDPDNLVNILIQSASPAIVATGMTFVLVTAGVDLSVGAIMFICAAIAGKMVLGGTGMGAAIAAMLLVGAMAGGVNAVLVTRFRILAFVATLGTLYLGRGFALWLTQTRAMNLPPDTFPKLASARWLGVPLPIIAMFAVLIVGHILLQRTPYGRQLLAVGHNAESARKAGLPVRRLLASVYILSGLCAALGAIVTLGQLGAVSPKFGETREFSAIAAAVLGGASLFGGRAQILPGTFLGAVLIQTLENGLVIVRADPYVFPLVTSVVIFMAVLIDATRTRWLEALSRRRIYTEETP